MRSLHIRDFAIIESLDVTFGSGLNVITGETGAGKSIVVGALKLILGERASTDLVRSGASKAVVEGVFGTERIETLAALLRDNEIDELPELILRREISSTYSRAFVNDSPVSLQTMRSIGDTLVDLHGQHDHQSLLSAATQLGLVDSFAGHGPLVDSIAETYDRLVLKEGERTALLERAGELKQKRDLLAFQVEEIDRINPDASEEEELEIDRSRLENAERLYAGASDLVSQIYESDHSVSDAIASALRELSALADLDSTLSECASELESASAIVSDVASTLLSYRDSIEFDQDRLEVIRERLMDFEGLKRKYGGTLEAVVGFRGEAAVELAAATDLDGNVARLSSEIEDLKVQLSSLSESLRASRLMAVKPIQSSVEAEMSRLGMSGGTFRIDLRVTADAQGWVTTSGGDRVRGYRDGMDRAQFLITTNPGEEIRPLRDVASGGEISRIMLALKTVLAGSARVPVLIFDEIDSGISGAIAQQVGESLRRLADSHQIAAITHLPQIAAAGSSHYIVEKSTSDGRTRSIMRQVSGRERDEAVAALLGGSEITDAALRSARELIAGTSE